MQFILAITAFALLLSPVPRQDKPAEKPTQNNDQHSHDVDARGDHVMGFSHEKATHHFRLYPDGGAIEITTNDPQDAATRDEIRRHLGHILGMFSAGNFRAPMLIHAVDPPGAATMKQLRSELAYKFENLDHGGRVTIVTHNSEALESVHKFLRFQIKDHKTGDGLEVVSAQK